MSATAHSMWCVIAVKSFARAKSRLATVLDARARATLAHDMFAHVLATCAGQTGIDGVVVATDDDDVATLATQRGALVIRDVSQQSLNTVIDRALDHVAGLGATHAIAIMSDLPKLQGDDLRDVIVALQEHDVVIVPDCARLGTNLLAMQLSTRLPSCFGRHDSFAAHVDRAHEAHQRSIVLELPGVAFDVDTPHDYAAFKS